jgi:hypothetical protein
MGILLLDYGQTAIMIAVTQVADAACATGTVSAIHK